MTKSAKWEVQYAKFFNFPQSSSSLNSDSPLLRPIPPRKKLRVKGTWVPSSSSNVALYLLIHDFSLAEPTLLLSLQDSIFEEHYVSKLNFMWPQGLCPDSLDKLSIRGSRLIFACYRDRTGQIQKFAMRFSSSEKCQQFMEVLECLKDGSEVNFSSTMLSSVFSEGIEREHIIARQSTNPERSRAPYPRPQQEDLGQAPESTELALPESFTSLLADCFTASEPGGNQAPAEFDLKQFLKAVSRADKPFIDLLEKIDKIILGLGGDLRI